MNNALPILKFQIDQSNETNSFSSQVSSYNTHLMHFFTFHSYVCHLNENSPQGAALVFSDAYSTQVHDDDMVNCFLYINHLIFSTH